MRPPVRACTLLAASPFAMLLLGGCGGSGKALTAPPSSTGTSSAPTATTIDVSTLGGNWYIPLDYSPAGFDGLLGSLSIQNGALTGVFRVNDPQHSPPCVPVDQDIAFTGAVDVANVLTLVSAPFSGSVATVKLQLPLVIGAAKQGTVTVTGPVCAIATNVNALHVPDISGTYAGTMTLNVNQPTANPSGTAPPSGPATLTFTQSAADADGRFPLTATLDYSAANCTLHTTLNGFVRGPFVGASDSVGVSLSGLVGTFNPRSFPGDGNGGSLWFVVPSGIPMCVSGFYSGPLAAR